MESNYIPGKKKTLFPTNGEGKVVLAPKYEAIGALRSRNF
jgi:hypothetical protein